MPSDQLHVFVSSKMQELAPERLVIKAALKDLKLDGWVFETDAGARPQPIQQTYKEEVKKADLYIGLFWKGYGDYTIEEYEYARQLGKDCLIYEKRADIAERDVRLQTFLDQIGEVEAGLTIQWFNTPEELRELVKQDVARWQAGIIRHYKAGGARLTYQNPLPVPAKVRQELLILLNKVKRFWINGVLDQAERNSVLFQLEKKWIAEAVENPWENIVELPDNFNSSALTSKPIAAIFEDVSRFLLILGEAGSGKTITMLELARDLIVQAEEDQTQAIPTIFNLSGWSDKALPLTDWLVEELKVKYQVPTKTGQLWLKQHRLLPLLDGFDEVTADRRHLCLNAISEFVQEYPTGVVVCSRLQEYTSLPLRLKLNGAICLQPLSSDWVDEYLVKVGPSLATLREALQHDQPLRALIKTPLMLNIMISAYQNQPESDFSDTGFESIANRRKHVLDTYIERMFQRKSKLRKPYGKETLKMWLHWLARKMHLHSRGIFLLEQLQPDWLSTEGQQVCYLFSSRILAGLLLGIGVGCQILIAGTLLYKSVPEFESEFDLATWFTIISITGLLLGLVTCFIDLIGLKLNRKFSVMAEIPGFIHAIIGVGLYMISWVALAGIYMGLAILTLAAEGKKIIPDWYALSWMLGLSLFAGILHKLILGSRADQHNLGDDISTVETLTWSWSRASTSGLWGAGVILIILLPWSYHVARKYDGMIMVNKAVGEAEISAMAERLAEIGEEIEELSRSKSDEPERISLDNSRSKMTLLFEKYKLEVERTDMTIRRTKSLHISTILIWCPMLGLAAGLLGGLKRGIVESKASPNQGIKLSIRNAALGGIAAGIGTGLILGSGVSFIHYGLGRSLESSIVIGLIAAYTYGGIAGLIIGFRYGGFDVLKHGILRLILTHKGHMPGNYVRALDYATTLGLLQKVGGGYIFIHRLLLEHFAALDLKGERRTSK